MRVKIKKKELVFTLFFLLLILILIFIPTGFARQIYVNSEGAKARVLDVDNTGIYIKV